MIAAQLTLTANVSTEIYIAEVLDAEALKATIYLCNESTAHWVDVDVALAHGATATITVDAPVRGEVPTWRYLFRGHSMRPTQTKEIQLELRHGDVVLVRASTNALSCTVVTEELVTPRALQAVEQRLDALVEDVLNKRAIAEATTGQDAAHVGGVQLYTMDAIPRITAGIYASGDALGDMLTFTHPGLGRGHSIEFRSLRVVDRAAQLAPFDLVLFSQPWAAVADNAVFDIPDEQMDNMIGAIPVTAANYANFADNAAAIVFPIELPATLLPHGAIFAQGVVRATPTYAAVDDVRIRLSARLL